MFIILSVKAIEDWDYSRLLIVKGEHGESQPAA